MNTQAATLLADLAFAVKRAASPHPGYSGHSLQQYLPTHERRDMTDEEDQLIDRERGKVIPKIFKSLKDSPAVEMSSPLASGVMSGGIGALLGAGVGGTLGAGSDKEHGDTVGTILGGLLGGGGLGALGYLRRNQSNEDLEEIMSRLPEKATRRDMMSDPVYQAERERGHQRQMMGRNSSLLAAALVGR